MSELYNEEEDSSWNPPSTFDRQTVKYWCAIDDLFEFMVRISHNLPVLLINKDIKSLKQRVND